MAILNLIVGLVFGRFPAKLGPKTPPERRGSSCSAGCSTNQPRRPILRPFRGGSVEGAGDSLNTNIKCLYKLQH